MAVIIPDNTFFMRGGDAVVSFSVTMTWPWRSRLAGTAFVDATPMAGTVVALSLEGPTIVGSADIRSDGAWEIRGIAERFSQAELLVIGIPRGGNASFAVSSRVRPVD